MSNMISSALGIVFLGVVGSLVARADYLRDASAHPRPARALIEVRLILVGLVALFLVACLAGPPIQAVNKLALA